MRSCVQPFKEGKDTTQMKRGKKQTTRLSGVGPRGKRPRKRSQADRTHKTGSCVRACDGGLQQHSTPREHARAHARRPARAHKYASKSAATVRFDARTRRYADGRGFAMPHQLARSRAERVAHLVEDRLGLCGKEWIVLQSVCCTLHAASCMLYATCMLHLACCMLHACCTCMLNACCMDCCLPSGRRSTVRRSRAQSRMRATNQGTCQTRPAQAYGRAGGWMGRAFTLVRAFVGFEATSCDDRAGPGGRTCSKLSQWSSYSST